MGKLTDEDKLHFVKSVMEPQKEMMHPDTVLGCLRDCLRVYLNSDEAAKDTNDTATVVTSMGIAMDLFSRYSVLLEDD